MAINDRLEEYLSNKDVFNDYDNKDKYKDHLLEQYKIYLEMADRISHRRQIANTFFLSINTALITLSGVLFDFVSVWCRSIWLLFVAGSGVALSYTWYRLIRSYKDLNSAKFLVIGEIESVLPIKPYAAEWKKIGEGKDPRLYLPFTHIETKVPLIFCSLYLLIILIVILSWTLALLRYVYTCITCS